MPPGNRGKATRTIPEYGLNAPAAPARSGPPEFANRNDWYVFWLFLGLKTYQSFRFVRKAGRLSR